jgi:hypothetical protein
MGQVRSRSSRSRDKNSSRWDGEGIQTQNSELHDTNPRRSVPEPRYFPNPSTKCTPPSIHASPHSLVQMQELSQRASRPYMPSNTRLYSDLASSSSSTTLSSWYAASAGFLTLMTPVFFNLQSITLAKNSPKKGPDDNGVWRQTSQTVQTAVPLPVLFPPSSSVPPPRFLPYPVTVR